MEFTLEKGREFTTIPAGEILPAEVVNAQLVTKEWLNKRTNEPQEMVAFEFVVTDGQFKNQHVWGEVWPEFYKHSKLYNWVKELLGQNSLEVGFKFTLETLPGLPCRVEIGNRPNKKNPDAPAFHFVDDVIRASDTPTAGQVFEEEYEDPF